MNEVMERLLFFDVFRHCIQRNYLNLRTGEALLFWGDKSVSGRKFLNTKTEKVVEIAEKEINDPMLYRKIPNSELYFLKKFLEHVGFSEPVLTKFGINTNLPIEKFMPPLCEIAESEVYNDYLRAAHKLFVKMQCTHEYRTFATRLEKEVASEWLQDTPFCEKN